MLMYDLEMKMIKEVKDFDEVSKIIKDLKKEGIDIRYFEMEECYEPNDD